MVAAGGHNWDRTSVHAESGIRSVGQVGLGTVLLCVSRFRSREQESDLALNRSGNRDGKKRNKNMKKLMTLATVAICTAAMADGIVSSSVVG